MTKKSTLGKLFGCTRPTTIPSVSHEKPQVPESQMLLRATEENTILKSKLETLEDKSKVLLSENDQLRVHVTKLEQEMTRFRETKEQVSSKSKIPVSSDSLKLEQMSKELEKFKKDNEQLKKQVSEKSKIPVSSDSSKLEQISRELEKFKKDNEQLEKALAESEMQCQKLQWGHEKLLVERTQLEEENKDCYEQIQQLTSQNQQILSARNGFNLDFIKLESDNNALKERVAFVSKTNETLIKESINLKRDNDSYQHEREALHEELKNVHNENKTLRAENATLSAQLEQLKRKNAEINSISSEQEHKKCNERIQQLTNRVTELQTSGQIVLDNYKKLIANQEIIKEDCARLCQTNAELKRENNHYKFEHESLRQECQELRRAQEQNENGNRLMVQLDEAKKRNNQLKKQYNKLEKEHTELKESFTGMATQTRTLLREKERLQKENNEFREKEKENQNTRSPRAQGSNIPRYNKVASEVKFR